MLRRSAICSSLYHLLNSSSISSGTSTQTISNPVPFFAVIMRSCVLRFLIGVMVSNLPAQPLQLCP